jgi:hypothetical protein
MRVPNLDTVQGPVSKMQLDSIPVVDTTWGTLSSIDGRPVREMAPVLGRLGNVGASPDVRENGRTSPDAGRCRYPTQYAFAFIAAINRGTELNVPCTFLCITKSFAASFSPSSYWRSWRSSVFGQINPQRTPHRSRPRTSLDSLPTLHLRSKPLLFQALKAATSPVTVHSITFVEAAHRALRRRPQCTRAWSRSSEPADMQQEISPQPEPWI